MKITVCRDVFGVLDKCTLMRGGRLREVTAHGGSTARLRNRINGELHIQFTVKNNTKQTQQQHQRKQQKSTPREL